MIRLSVNECMVRGADLDVRLARCREMGYRRVEIVASAADPDLDLRRHGAARIARACAAAGVEPIALYPTPLSPWPGAREENRDYCLLAVEAALELGVDKLVFPPLPSRAAWTPRLMADDLAVLLAAIGDRPLRICLENHCGWPLSAPEDYLQLFAVLADPRVGVAFDTGHFTAAGVDQLAAVATLGGRIRHVHLKDHVGKRSVALGHGTTPNCEVLAALRAQGYDGHASIEVECEDKAEQDAAVAAAWAYAVDELGCVA